MNDSYTYDRMWDASGDSIGWVLSDEAGAMAAVILEHPDDFGALAVDTSHSDCFHTIWETTVERAAAWLGAGLGTDARPDDAAPARCLVATVRFACVCVMCCKSFEVVAHIQAGEEIDPAYQTCPHCKYHRGHTGTATLVNVRSERTSDA